MSTHAGTFRNHQGTPEHFKPYRDRPVRSKSVACPTCKAPAGEPCQKDGGGSMGYNYHRRRRGLAIQEGF